VENISSVTAGEGSVASTHAKREGQIKSASSLSDLVEHNRFGDDKRRSGL